MASTALKTGAGVAGLAAIVGGGIALLQGPAPAVGLVHLCTTLATTDGKSDCPQRSWDKPTVDSFVLSGTDSTALKWGNADYRWRRYGDLRPIDYIEVCNVPIKPGLFAPPNRPEVDPKCGDPCGCSSTFKKPVKVAAFKKEIPANGALIEWTPGTPDIDAVYTLYRGPLLNETIDASKRIKVFEQSAAENKWRIIYNQPIGAQYFAMTAKDKDGSESVQTKALTKVMRLPAPSKGAIEGPKDGAIETK